MLINDDTKIFCFSDSINNRVTNIDGRNGDSFRETWRYTTSVLLSFKASLFSNVQFLISLMQFSADSKYIVENR